jgi:isopenicillin N synthase-like dioxygenase
MNDPNSPSAIAIPIIDFSAFCVAPTESDPMAQAQTAELLFQACHEVGFVYLKQHGVPAALLAQTFAQSQRFFALSLAQKQALAWPEGYSNRGYVSSERERLDPAQPGDLKESFNVGAEPVTRQTTPSFNPALSQNCWLPNDDDFKATLLAFFDACTDAANRVFRAFELALHLPPNFIVSKHMDREHMLRLLHYPSITQATQPGQIRAGAHADYGSITLLFQDQVGGLEILTADGQWHAAPSIPDTILVNTGELMARWSNDVFRSTVHRVGLPTGATVGRSRYSIAFFCNPNPDVEIACLEGCQSPANPPKYPPVLAGQHLVQLLKATY